MGISGLPRALGRAILIKLAFRSTPSAAQVKVQCSGFDEQWGSCPDQPSCQNCVPQNCVFADWGDWFDAGGCSQLEFRERQVQQSNNECGQPCNGSKSESRRIVKAHCNVLPQNCTLSDWQAWTPCLTGTAQSFRTRTPTVEPEHGGTACEGILKETRECELNMTGAVNCAFSSWHVWTDCSSTCGRGEKTRMRRVSQQATFPGRPCQGELSENAPCVMAPCPSKDCVLSPWGAWSQCVDGHSQKFRTRVVLTAVQGAGKPCDGTTKETAQCPTPQPLDCTFSDWEPWTLCDKPCGGGQMERARQLVSKPRNGGVCRMADLHVIQECNVQPCTTKLDCEFSPWGQWAACTNKCGRGTTWRQRSIAREATAGGVGCYNSLAEGAPCNDTSGCGIVLDCRWNDWGAWSACTRTCGAGWKARSRSVEQRPTCNGQECGEPCAPLDSNEHAPCSLQPCGPLCVDAQWADWEAWSACSSTCSSGFQHRTRQIGIEANSCGKPLSGLREEYRSCSQLPPCVPSQDCLLGDWGDWSSCSCSCYGVRERNRVISQYARGDGKACVLDGLREAEGCNPGVHDTPSELCGVVPPTDCVLGDWGSWGPCSRTCGGGQKQMHRKIITYPEDGGKLCGGALTNVTECATQPCTYGQCIDCEWSDWEDWGGCSHCGGQRFRYRHIATMPNHCGKPCALDSAKEVGNCTSHCQDQHTCSWSDWSASVGCQANSCGGTSMRTRTLSFSSEAVPFGEEPPVQNGTEGGLFVASLGARCSGTQLYTATCDTASCKPVCEPRNCSFGTWGDWTQQTCLGLCVRSRVIHQHNNECGEPCAGKLEETKRCAMSCDLPVDCTLGDWTEWGACGQSAAQVSRTRAIKSYPQNGGKPCAAKLGETRACGGNVTAEACEFADWQPWSSCTSECDGGITKRKRIVARDASGGGDLCTGSLEDLQSCNTQACNETINCQTSDWADWAPCDADKQKTRERKITTLAVGSGAPCGTDHTYFPMRQIASCIAPVDCVLASWTNWDVCDASCGGGQQQRHRSVVTYPEFGGKACESDLVDTQGCNTQSCGGTDCVFGQWSAWTPCSATCGTGEVSRKRTIATQRKGAGKGCKGPLAEVVKCDIPDCPHKDCAWGDWSQWAACSCSCGGGQTNRVRHIVTMPNPGGKPCSNLDKEEMRPCNTFPCEGNKPVDGTWGQWSEWTACSATCNSGISFRSRTVATMASDGGNAPAGLDRESRFCNFNVPCVQSVDCAFTDWDDWSDCSTTCNGVKRRARRISQFGRGLGKFCEGGLKETFPCNPSAGEAPPKGCGNEVPVDCKLSDWLPWSMCTASCGGGQHIRSRDMITPPAFGGKPCDHALREVKPCQTAACPGPLPVDCVYGEWEDWNACGKCGGQRKRYRRIQTLPQNGGANCEAFDAEETANCTSPCEQHGYCTWSAWGQWSPCTSRCGEGRRVRKRSLALVSDDLKIPADTTALMEKYLSLSSKADAVQPLQTREIASAFALGFLSLAAAVGAFKSLTLSRFSRPRERSADEGSHRLIAVAEDDSQAL